MQAIIVIALLSLVCSASAQNLDVSILNFALNLEYLEANFYSCAAFGVPLSGSRIGNGPVAVGCKGQALLSPEVLALATEIANDEIAHVDFLRAALGAAAVDQPQIDIGLAFARLFNAAYGISYLIPFQAYSSDVLFLLGAFIFEDVGVTAYKGAAPLITNKAYLGAAAGILGVEGYHAGAIRLNLIALGDQAIFPYILTTSFAANAVATLRAAVDFIGMDDFGITSGSTAIIAPVDSNAIAFGRLPKNVLSIVYLAGTDKGGFFPNGMNGPFNSTATAPGGV